MKIQFIDFSWFRGFGKIRLYVYSLWFAKRFNFIEKNLFVSIVQKHTNGNVPCLIKTINTTGHNRYQFCCFWATFNNFKTSKPAERVLYDIAIHFFLSYESTTAAIV